MFVKKVPRKKEKNIFRTAGSFLITFSNSNQSLSRSILTLLCLEFETFVYAQITITQYCILFTNFLTWYEVETYFQGFQNWKIASRFLGLGKSMFGSTLCTLQFRAHAKISYECACTETLYVIEVWMSADNLHFALSTSVLRSSSPGVFLGKGVLKICSKFTAEHSCRSVISISCFATHTSAWVFSCKIAAYFESTFL